MQEDLKPGQWLRLRDLAQLLETSTMPIREALQILASEGLVTLYPHRGAQVTMLSTEELEELYMARLGLEGLAARLGAEGITNERLLEMQSLLASMEEAIAVHNLANFLVQDAEFHAIHYRASGRPRLVERIDQLRKSCSRYMKWGRISITDADATCRLHRDLVRACSVNDGVWAERIIRTDIDAAVAYLRRHMLAEQGSESPGDESSHLLLAGHRVES